MSPTNKKIVGGIVALLFVVSIVQSNAIVKIAKTGGVTMSDQTAQVTPQSACLIVKYPLGTRVARDFHGEINGKTYTTENYMIGVQIKNVCSTKVYVIEPSHFLPAGTLENPPAAVGFDPIYGDIISEPARTNNFKVGIGAFPGITAYTNPVPAEFLSNTQPSLLTENLVTEFTQGPDDILTIPNSQTVGIELSQQNLVSFGLAPNATRNLWYFVSVVQPGWYPDSTSNENPDMNFSMTRVALKSLRWFRGVDYTSDSQLFYNEVKTYTLPATLSAEFTTSGVAIGENY